MRWRTFTTKGPVRREGERGPAALGARGGCDVDFLGGYEVAISLR